MITYHNLLILHIVGYNEKSITKKNLDKLIPIILWKLRLSVQVFRQESVLKYLLWNRDTWGPPAGHSRWRSGAVTAPPPPGSHLLPTRCQFTYYATTKPFLFLQVNMYGQIRSIWSVSISWGFCIVRNPQRSDHSSVVQNRAASLLLRRVSSNN